MDEAKIYNLSFTEKKELQKILLEIYCDIAEVCRKYNLNIMLGGGTCLGAVRHQGFIPWDDDMDLMMPRKDYNKLLEVFYIELGEKYDLVDLLRTHSGQKLFAKIMKKDTTFIESVTNIDNSPTGIFVDIFPIEFLPDNPILRPVFLFFAHFFTKSILVIIGYQLGFNLQSKARRIARYRIFGKLTSFMSIYKWNFLYSIFISSCNGTKYCTIPSGLKGVYKELQPVDTFFPLSVGVFEGKKVNLPHKYDTYLKNLYGNYMELPPLEQRKSGHLLIKFSINNIEKTKEVQVNGNQKFLPIKK
jgi:lipopolysaccharide cholinephosphotransferase